MSLLRQIILVVTYFAFACSAFAQGGLSGVIPTDPSLNRVNWALASKGATATGGSPTGGFTAASLIDGLSSGNQQYVAVTIQPQQSIQIDLGQLRTLDGLQLHLWDGDDRFYRFRVEHSTDAQNYVPLVDKSVGEYRGIVREDFAPVQTRYLKIYGLFNSANNHFHLYDELIAFGPESVTPHQPEVISVDAVSDAGTSSNYINSAQVRTLHAGIYTVAFQSGASSIFDNDSVNNGRTWQTSLNVSVPMLGKHYAFGFTHDQFSRYATAAQAETAALGSSFTIHLPVEAPVYFWFDDAGPSNNRGGVNYTLTQVSGPNSSLLAQVRDSMTRSVLWQQRAVANWQSWVTTSNANCFGCHIQTQATVGLNESKAKLPDLPIDEQLMDRFVSAYGVWQNSAGWVSPFHSSYYRTQTSLWSWAVQSFSGPRFTQLTGNLISGLNWLVSQQGPGGGWFWDHDSNILWSDTAGYNEPSATHTAGNIEALATLIERVQSGNFIPVAGTQISANEVQFAQNSTNVFDVVLVPQSNVTGLKVTVLDSFASNNNFVINELEIFDQFSELAVSTTQANFSQTNYPIANTINDIRDNIQDGWAYSPGNVLVNPAQGLWKFSQPQTIDRVRFTQIQAAHQLERLRIEVTTDPNPTLSSNFIPVSITDVGLFEPPAGFVTALKNAANRMSGYAGGAWTYNRSVRTAAQTIIGLFEALPHLNTAEATAALSRIEQAATFLRSIQRTDGGWGENANGADASKVYPSAQALRALLLVTNQGLDPQLARGAEYLLNRQYGDGFWKSASFQTDLAATTWVEIALPTLFEVLQNQYERSRITDLLTFSLQGAVELSWSPIPEAASYTIYRRTEGSSFTPIQSGYVNGVVTYTDTDVVDEQTYYYMIRWVDGTGAESADSNEASGTPYGMQCGQDSPPQITSHPQTGASPGHTYGYQLEAFDPDQGDTLTFSLVTAPPGMSMNTNGLVQWLPTSQQAGSHFVRVRVEDRIGRFATQAFRVEVTPIFINYAPQFVSNPVMQAYEGNQYTYNSEALDPNIGDVLVYSIESAPQGMSINPTTGRLSWTPNANQIGTHNVAIRARDIAGLIAQQSYTLEVLPNAPPQFVSSPVVSTSALGLYFYNAEASDPEGGALTFSKIQGPLGLSIHPQSGVVTWTPNQSLIGSYPVVLRVRDPAGLTATQSYTLEVRNHEPPVFSSQPVTSVELGSQYIYQVSAFDPEAGSVSISLVNGPSGMQLSSTNSLTWTPAALATAVPVRLRAVDNLGAETFQDFTVDVVPAGTGGPGGGIPGGSTGSSNNGIFVGLDTPVPGAALTTPVSFVGDIAELSTSYGSALTWVAEFRRDGDTSGIQIGSGVGAGQNINFGSIDPGVLADDSYRLYIIVDTPTHLLDFWFPYTVETRKKMGEFSLSVTDFSIPLTGISLNVSRQYRSFDRSPYEFGNGWRMQLPGRVIDNVPEQPLSAMYAGARVFVTRPDGRRVGFTFMPYPVSVLLPFHVPYFRPDPGVTDVLEVPATYLFKSGIFYYEFVDPFNPTEYYLTTKDRLRYLISETEGLKEIRDPNFNTLSFTAGSIVHSSGQSVSIQRDAAQRITRIIVPGGDDIEYLYDASGNLIRVTNTLQQHTHYTYDSANRLLTIRDANNTLVLTNVYDANGRLQKQIDALGHEIQLGIDTVNNRETIIDRRGNTSVYQYDTNGNLTQVTNALGGVKSFTYDQNFNRTSETDELGRTRQFTYDASGNLNSTTDALGRTTSISFNSFSQPTTIVGPHGATRSFAYDGLGQLTSVVDYSGKTRQLSYQSGKLATVVDGLGNAQQLSYDALGRLSVLTDPLGKTISFDYDQAGNLTRKRSSRTLASGTQAVVQTEISYDSLRRPTLIKDGEGRQVILEWNSYNKPSRFVDKKGQQTLFEYNTLGALTRIIWADSTTTEYTYDAELNKLTDKDRLGRITSYSYDALGRLIRITYPDGVFRQFSYDAVGNRISVTDELGRTTTHTYDAENQEISILDAVGGVVTKTYDAAGRIATFVDQLSRTNSYQYDGEGRLTRTTHPDGSFSQIAYDANGRESVVTDSLGFTTSKVYDALGRILQIVDELGNADTFQYDEVGNKIREIDRSGLLTSMQYNNAGLLVSRSSPWGGNESFGYDGNDNLISHTDGLGRLNTFVYDLNDKRIRHTNPLGAVTEWGYDPEGNLLSVKDPLNQTTSYVYDLRNRRITEIDPLQKNTSYTYDAVGNLRTRTDRNGRLKEFTYDALNRQITEVWKNNGQTVRSIARVFDAFGDILSEGDSVGTYAYVRDSLGRVTSSTQTGLSGLGTFQLTRSFDPEGNLIGLSDSLGESIQSVYDPRRLLSTRTWSAGGLGGRVDFAYDARGEQSAIERFADSLATIEILETEFGFDGAGRIASIDHQAGSNLLDSYDYQYDAASQLSSDIGLGNSATYQYDTAGQLLSVANSAYPNDGYGYDLNGNRTTGSSIVGPGNRITQDANFDYLYDDEGNLVTRTNRQNGESEAFSYNHNNQLTAVVKRNSASVVISNVQFEYDVGGRRTTKSVNGLTYQTVYHQEQPWVDLDANGTLVKRYLYSDKVDQVLSAYSPSTGVSHYLSDRLGSVRKIADNTGAIAGNRNYDAFGLVRAQAGSVDRFGFTGRELDAEFGMYHFRARTYDPKLGRFISQDPLSFSAGDLNLYRYVNNSPLNGVDPFGTTSMPSYGVTLTPALMLLAAVSTQMYAENVLYFSTGRKGPLLTTLDAVVDTARDLSYLLVQGQSNARTFDFMKVLLVRLVAIPTILDHLVEPDVVRYLPDGIVLASTTRVVPTTDGATRVDVTEKTGCRPEIRIELQQAVNRHCKSQKRRCDGGQSLAELLANKEANLRCADARDRINFLCFGGGDPGHRQAADEARRAAQKCAERAKSTMW